jgi:hypothetical protein
MLDLKNLLPVRDRAGDGPESEQPPSDFRGKGLEFEYHEVVTRQFERWGIRPECAHIEIRKLGRAEDGFDIFVAMVRIREWDRTSGLRLLLGLPILERRVRRSVRQTWLADLSHFTGLWVHASEGLTLGGDRAELRELLASLTLPVPDSGVGE